MKNREIKISPSILSADFKNLKQDLNLVEKSGADLIHCDVMDGHFVPNISFGPMIVDYVKKSVATPLDVHLMISDPKKYIQAFSDAGADIITIHAEIEDDLEPILKQIKETGTKVGVAVNPDKSEDLFLPYLDQIDMVLIMTVYAGFGGQKFIPDMLTKIRKVYDESVRIGKEIDIEVDGGINNDAAKLCAEQGANVFVAGSYIFGQEDYSKQIELVRNGALEGISNID